MFFIMMMSFLICAGVGLLLKFVIDNRWFRVFDYIEITWREFYVTLGVICLLVVPSTAAIGWKLAVNNKMTFEQYENGWEEKVKWDRVACERDGSCLNDYNCDPYIVMVPYTYSCGKSLCTGVRAETHYHSCPYTTEEWNFFVTSSLGDTYTIDRGRFPDNPNAHLWRRGVDVSRGFEDRVGSGIPERWREVKARLDSLRPGPVSRKTSYINYVIASNNTILRKYGTDIQSFRSKQLLPAPKGDIFDFYRTSKVQFVNSKIRDKQHWNTELSYLNAGLGSTLEGDLHVVVVNNRGVVNNPTKYVQTLEAFWKSWDYQSDKAIAKNSIVLVLGTTNDSTIAFADGFSGMPNGNELFFQTIRSTLKGKALNVDTLLGEVRRTTAGTVTQTGTVGQILIKDKDTHFRRMPMGKYAYLKGEITPSQTSMKVLYIICTLFAVLCWIGPMAYNDGETTYYTRRYY